MREIEYLENCIGFQWDQGNVEKNQQGHNVTYMECEEVFFNKPLLLSEDVKHSQKENRYYVLGKTNEQRKLFIAFTLRDNLIRVISARDMSKKEKQIYA
jgi:uncharacterized DUF497 family protein